MTATTIFQGDGLSVSDYRCGAGPHDRPFAEHHLRHSISYVRGGSFGCRCRGQSHELVTGAFLIGHPGDEYVCSHDHSAGGDDPNPLRPDLALNSAVSLDDPTNLIRVILYGIDAKQGIPGVVMPGFATGFSDGDVARSQAGMARSRETRRGDPCRRQGPGVMTSFTINGRTVTTNVEDDTPLLWNAEGGKSGEWVPGVEISLGPSPSKGNSWGQNADS
eukprot:gene16039-21263_t